MKEIDILAELVKQEYHSGDKQANQELIALIEKMLGTKSLRLPAENGLESMLVGINFDIEKNPSAGKGAVMLAGHMDTVAPHPKLKLSLANGILHGRGSVDMKPFIAAVIKNAAAFKNMDIPILLALTHDEETNGIGTVAVASYIKENGIDPRLIILGEPSSGVITYRNRGVVKKEIETESQRGERHSGDGGLGANDYLRQIENYIDKFRKEYGGKMSINTETVHDRKSCTTIPAYVRAVSAIRFDTDKDYHDFNHELTKFINTLRAQYPDAVIRQTPDAIKSAFGGNKETAYQIADRAGIPVSDYIRPGFNETGVYQDITNPAKNAIIFGAGNRKLCHTAEEHITVDELNYYSKKLPAAVATQIPEKGDSAY